MPPKATDRCVNHEITMQRHETEIASMRDRVTTHDRTLFGYNGTQRGIVSTVHELDAERRARKSNTTLIRLTLLAVVLEGLTQIALAAWK